MSKELPKRWRKKKTDKLEARPAGRFGLKASVSYLLLEQRMVFDGAAVDTAAAATADPAAPAALPGEPHGPASGPPPEQDIASASPDAGTPSVAGEPDAAEPASPPPAERPAPIEISGEAHAVTEPQTTAVIFIDASVPDAQALAQNAAPGTTVIMLDPTRDGLQQIASYLEGRYDIDSLHIVSHGDSGELRLGNGLYNNANIEEFAATLSEIGSALSRDGDILLYGCDTANGAAGERFVSTLSAMTGADIAASSDPTGAAGFGGDWTLEYRTGTIESDLAITQEGQDGYDHVLDVGASTGNGALLVSAGNALYSVDAATGKATLLTTVPSSVGGVSFGGPVNSIAVDHANGLVYYVDSTVSSSNRALFAYDYVNNSHVLIDADLTNNGTGASITVGSSGVGGGGAAFANGTLYLAVENTSGTNDTIFRITFSGNGRTVATANVFVSNITNTDWGDVSVDTTNNVLLSLAGTTLNRYNLTTGALVSTATMAVSGQSGTDINGNFYVVGTTMQQINPVTGASIGTGATITTNGSTALANISDATRWVPPTGSIGDRIFDDDNNNGVVDAGESGLANVTVQLIDDVNGNGTVDAGERVLATDTTNVNGAYLFTGVLPGAYIVRVTDANGVLGGASPTTGTATRAIAIGTIGASNLTADFGYNRTPPVVDLNSTPAVTNIVTNGGFAGSASGWSSTGSTSYSSTIGSGGAIAWTSDASTGTLTQTGLTGLNNGPAPSGSAQLVFGLGWNNGAADFGVPATLTISVGGVVYATVTTPTGAGPAIITYQNGATGSPASIAASTLNAWTYTDITINLPTTVAASGNLVFTYNTAAFGSDDISIDNVRVNAYTDATPGRDWSAGYTENGTPVSIAAPAASITDADNANMASATIVLTNKQAGDQLRIGGATGTILANGSSGTINGIAYTVVDNGTSVTIQLSGSATKAAYASTIQSVVFESTSDAPSTVARVFNVNVSDGTQLSNTAVSTISVTAVNDPPSLDLDASGAGTGFGTGYTENGSGVAIVDADVSIVDPDNTTMSSATIVISNGQAGDLLSVAGALPSGITASYNAGTYTLTLTGTATQAAYQTALQQVRFSSSSEAIVTTSRAINITVNDGTAASNTAVATVAITAVNDAPVNILPASFSVAEDGTLGITGLSVIDLDAGSGTITVTLAVSGGTLAAASAGGVTVANSGTASITLSGTLANINAYLAATGPSRVTFSPVADFNGPVTLTMTTNDGGNTGTGGALSDTDTSTITVSAVADAVNDAVSTAEDTATTFNVLANDTFSNAGRTITAINGTAISVNGTIAVAGGTIRLNADGSLGFTPTADYNGGFSFTYTVSSGGVSETATVNVTVTPVNDAPTLSFPGAQSTSEDAPRAIAGVTVGDIDSTALTTTLTSTNGTLSVTAAAGAVISGNGSGTVTISGTAAQINAALAGLTYTPVADFNGSASIGITTSDGALNASGSVAVSVSAVADAVNDSVSTSEDTAATFNPLANDGFSNSGRAITAINGVAIAVNGSVSVSNGSVRLNSDGTLTFTPTANYNGAVSFTYTVTSGGTTETATVSVTVNSVNDAPAGADKTITIAEDGSYSFTAADFGFSDPNDNPANTLQAIVITTLPANGSLTLSGTAVTAGQVIAAANIPNLRWTPAQDANGAALASFTFQVRDNGGTANGGQNTDPTSNTITFDVTPVNDAPVNILPASYATNEDTSIQLSGISVTDVDAGGGNYTVTLSVGSGGTLTATSSGGVTVAGSGTASITLSGTLASINAYLAGATAPVFVPTANFNGNVTLTVVSNDGALTDTDSRVIVVAAVNDPPVGSNGSITTPEDTAFSGTLPAATDADGQTLTYGPGATAPLQGSVTINPNGTYTYTPAANFNGSDRFTFTVSDGIATVEYTITVTVGPVNDAPVANPVTATTNEDTTLTVGAAGGVLASASDVDGDTLTVTTFTIGGTSYTVGQSATGAWGSFTLNANGSYSYVPAANFNGAVPQIGFTISDGSATASSTLTISVAAVNDAPGSTPIASQSSADAQVVSLNISGNFFDVDVGDTRSYSAIGLPPGLTLNPVTGVIAGTLDRSASLGSPYSVTVTATDAGGLSTSRSFTWTISNPAPVARDDVLATTENASISGSILASNGNGADSDPDGDPLAVSAVNGVAGAVGSAVAGSNGGSFTIAANGSYSFVPGTAFDDLAAGQTRTTSVTYTISDGQGGTSTATVTVTVTGQNDAPVAVNDVFSTPEDTPVTFDPRANDSDIDGNALTITQINGAAITVGVPVTVTGGTVTLNANGTLTFAPALNYNGSPSFSYTVSDGTTTATATVNGTVTPVNDAPVARDDMLATTENTSINGSVLISNGNGADSDPDGDPLTVSAVNGVAGAVGSAVAGSNGGSFTIAANGSYSFVPGTAFDDLAAGQTRTTSVTYTISDGQGGTSTATVTVTVAGQNDAPVAVNDVFSTPEDTPVTFDPRANDSDIDGNALTITQINGAAITVGVPVTVTGGTVTLNANGTLTFAPALNYNGSPSFSYTVSDGTTTATATVNGTVTPVNDAPVAAGDNVTIVEDTPFTFDPRGNDSDIDGDPLNITQINGVNIASGGSVVIEGGTVTLNANGTLTVSPAANYNGPISFTYTISDGAGGGASATVSGTVTPVNDAPVAIADVVELTEDGSATFDPRANDTDTEGNPLSITQINGSPITVGVPVSVAEGSVTLNANGTLTFVPNANFNGATSFTYTVSDGQGGLATATVAVTVAGDNDAPISSDGSLTTNEDTAFSGTLPAASDADNDPVTYSAGTTVPAHGTVTIAANGSYTYTPAANFAGTDTFSFVVSDGLGGRNEYYISVTVLPVNDAPGAGTIPALSQAEASAVNLNISGYFSDLDGDTLSYSAGGTLPPGLTLDSATGVISGTIASDASQGAPGGVYTVVITASDGQGGSVQSSFVFTVTNPAPVANNDTVSAAEDTPASFNVITGAGTSSGAAGADSDPDGDTLQLVSASAGNGTVAFLPDGTITYTPNANFNGTDTIVYTISDGQGGTATATVTISVGAGNDPPVASPIVDRTVHDGDAISLDASAFFSDADGDDLIFTVTGLPPGLSYDPATGLISGSILPDASGPTGSATYTVQIIASDGSASAAASFTYTVLNLPPDAQNDTVTTPEGTPVDINVLANDTDPDGDVEEIIRVNNVVLTVGGPAVTIANGSVELVIVGGLEVLRFTPNANFNGVETFSYTVDDGNSGIDTATVTITVTPVNDVPDVAAIPDATSADGQALTYNLGAFFSDVDGDALTYVVSGLPAGLSYDPLTGIVSGTIDRNASQGGPSNDGVYTVTVTASDGNGGTRPASFTLTITNPGPAAVNDTATTNEDTPVEISPLLNDADPDGDPLTITSASAGQGTVSILNGVITYTPSANFNGTDTIVYTVSDGNGGVSSAVITVTVSAVNDAPVGTPIPTVIDSNGETVLLDVSSHFSDADRDDLDFTITGLPPGLTYDPETGIISGTLAPDASTGGPYTVTVTASDGNGGTAQTSFTWQVLSTPPLAANDAFAVNENATTTGNVLANDGDPGGGALSVTGVAGAAGNVGVVVTGSQGGSFVIDALGNLSFDPGTDFDDLRAGETRTTTISYQVTNAGGETDTATVVVTVTGVNDLPTAGTLPDRNRSDGETVNYNVGDFFSDIEGEDIDFTITGLPPGLSYDAETGRIFGAISSDASQGGPGNDGIYLVTVSASDGNDGTVERTYRVIVTNPAPTAANDAATTLEDTPVTINVLGNDVDPDGDTLTLDPTFTPTAGHGTVTVNPDGTLRYTPAANFSGTDTIVYRITDGQGGFSTALVNITVTAVNDDPVGTPIADMELSDGATVDFNVSGNFSDPENGALTYTVTGLPPGLSYDAATGVISGTIASGASGPTGSQDYVVTVSASDGQGGTASLQFTYTVVNLVPEASNDTIQAVEDVPILIPVLANDADPDGDAVAVISVDGTTLTVGGPAVAVANGNVALVLDGGVQKLLFTPNANYNGAVSFTYGIGDGNGGSSSATVTVNVAAQNDAPTAPAPIPDRSQADGSAVSFDVSGNFQDLDGDTLSYSASGTLPPGLTLDTTTGVISGTIASDASQGAPGGVYTVVITASDGQGGSVQSSFVFTVTNPAPVANNDTVSAAEDTPASFNVITGAGTSSGAAGADSDPDGDTLQLVSASAGNGTVAFLPDGTITYTPNANFNGTDTIVYTISDGQGGTATATVTISVGAGNDPPVVDLNGAAPGTGYAGGFVEDGGPVQIVGPDAVIQDVENDIVSLDVTIGGTDRNGAAEQVSINGSTTLVYGTAASGTVSFGSVDLTYNYDGAGLLRIQNAAGAGQPIPAEALTALIHALRYENISNNPTAGDRSFTFVATDSAGASSAAAVATISVSGTNTAPVAVDDAVTTTENAVVTGTAPGVLGNDSDPEGDALGVVAVAGSAGNLGVPVAGSVGGSFVLQADGSYTFDPGTAFNDLQAGEQRVTSISYTISDGNGGVAIATLSVTVTGENDAPVGSDDAITLDEDTQASGTLPVATDPDGDALTYALVGDASNGTVTVSADGSYVYTPAANYFGPDSFTYSVSDGVATVTYTITIDVLPVGDGPVAGPLPDRAMLDGATPSIDVSSAFSDPDGEALAFTANGLPAGLTISTTGVISGTVDNSASQQGGGLYTVTVTAEDAAGNTVSRSFTITVTNPVPTAVDDAGSTGENTPATGNVIGNDSDPDGDTLTVIAVGASGNGVGTPVAGSAGGNFTILADGSYSFDPGTAFDDLAAGETRQTSVGYTISDGEGGVASAILRITVTGSNDTPIASDSSITTSEDSVVTGAIAASDAEGDTLSFTLVAQPANGSVTLNPDGTYSYAPAADFNGTDSFDVTVSDGNGGVVTVTVTVTVTPVNDAPVGSDGAITVGEDTTFTGTLPVASDVDGPALTYAAGSIAPAHGTVTISSDGSFSYEPDPDYTGADSFTYTVSDGIAPPQTYTIIVTVSGANDAPIAVDDSSSTEENTAVSGVVTANDSDLDGDPLTVIGVGAPSGGVGSVVAGSAGGSFVIAADGSFTFTPGAAFDDLQLGEQRQTSVTYTISDGNGGVATATLVVTVNGSNDAPSGGTLPPLAGNDAGAVSYDASIAFSDIEGDALSFTAADLPAGLTISSSGAITGTLASDASIGGPGANGVYVITVTATDPGGLSVSRSFTLTVTNPPPTTGNDSATTAEDTPLVGASVAANDSDPDGDALTYALVSGTANGTLTFRADGSYDYVPAPNFSGIDSFTYSVSDGQGGIAQAVVTITVGPVNDAPVAVDDTGAFTIDEDGRATITPLANDSDADGNPLTITRVDNQAIAIGGSVAVSGGVVTLNGDGSLSFVASADYNGAPSFTYTISDGLSEATATISGTVNPVNDAPVNGLPSSFSGTEDTPLALTGIMVADNDAGSGIITVTLSVDAGSLAANSGGGVTVAGSGTGSIVLSGTLADINAYLAGPGVPIYQPVANSGSAVTLTMLTSDGGNSGAGGALSDTDTATIILSGVNDPPLVSAPPASGAEDTPIAGAIVASDPDGDDLSFSLTSPPANGTVSLAADGSYVYMPNPNFNGTDNFTITVDDGNGGIVAVPVSITVTPVNDAPIGADASFAVAEDGTLSGTLPLASDPESDPLTYALGGQASFGVATVNTDGTFTYVPAPDFSGTDSFTYTVSDGSLTVTHTVTITVGEVNDPPVAANDTATVAEDSFVAIDVLANDGDPDGGTVSVIGASAGNGAVTLNADGTLTYTPNPNFTGTDTIVYTISDGQGGTASATVTVTVTPANDAPVGSDVSASVAEDGVLSGMLPGSDPDGDALTFVLATAPANGTAIINADGSYSYAPNPDFNGSDSFTFTISDGTAPPQTYTVFITVTPEGDAPVANPTPLVVSEDTPASGALNAYDPDGGPLTYALTAPPANGIVALNADGTYTYTPNPGFNGPDSFAITVTDSSGATVVVPISFSVAPVDDAPVANPSPLVVTEDTPAIGNLNASDPDGDPLTYTVATQPANGTLIVNADGSYSYTPNPNFNGPDSFTVAVSDPQGNTILVPVSFTVTPVNDSPVANPSPLIVTEDTPAIGSLNAYDPDGDTLSFVLSTPPSGGTVVINPDGTYTYTPNPNFFGSDSFTVTVIDDSGASVSILVPVSVTISPVNDPPVANPPPLTVTEDTPATGSLNASDPDGDLLGYALAAPPANGTVILNGDGTYTYTPNPNFFGPDSFSVTISDSAGASITVSVAVTVNPVDNDAPVASPTPLVVSEDTPASGALNAYDPDGGPVTYVLTTPPANGIVTLNADGSYTYTPNPNFNGSDSFTITVTDSSGATLVVPISFTVAPVDDAPVGSDLSITLPEDGGFVGTLPAGSDPDGQPVTFALGRPPSSGIATVNPDGSFSYVPAANFFGTDSFTYVISDGTSISVHTVTITVTAVNDAPVAGPDAAVVPQDTPTIVPVLLNDGDVDGDGLTIIEARAGIGAVSINADGTLTYTPPSGFVGVTTITYIISDGKGGLATGQVLVSVLPFTATVPSDGPRPLVPESPGQTSPEPQTAAEPIILDAVGRIADLDGVTTSLTVHGPILSALNSMSPLDGVTGKPLIIGRSLPGVDPRGESSLDRYLRFDAERREIDRSPPEVQGFSRSMELRPQFGDGMARGELTVQSVLRGRTVTLEFNSRFDEGNQHTIEFRVLQADGRPLPDWLRRAGKDIVVGDMPVDLDEIRLKIVAILADGSSAERNIIVDLSTGEIRPAPDQLGWSRPPIFQENFALPSEFTEAQLAFLAEALSDNDTANGR
jgi:VCBS repeat-containing protein